MFNKMFIIVIYFHETSPALKTFDCVPAKRSISNILQCFEYTPVLIIAQ